MLLGLGQGMLPEQVANAAPKYNAFPLRMKACVRTQAPKSATQGRSHMGPNDPMGYDDPSGCGNPMGCDDTMGYGGISGLRRSHGL